MLSQELLLGPCHSCTITELPVLHSHYCVHLPLSKRKGIPEALTWQPRGSELLWFLVSPSVMSCQCSNFCLKINQVELSVAVSMDPHKTICWFGGLKVSTYQDCIIKIDTQTKTSLITSQLIRRDLLMILNNITLNKFTFYSIETLNPLYNRM